MKNTERGKKGFTAMEILVVLAIFLLLVSVSLTAFYGRKQVANIDRDAENVLTYLQKARNQTVSSVDNSSFGVRFSSSTAVLFKGTSYTASSTQSTFSYGSGVVVSVSLAGGATQLYFQRLTGEPSATGTITFTSNTSTTSKSIIIRATGLAEIQ
jgi:prepilin-type N-terminal cleavage/methylation domain-containing protein